MSKVTKEYLDKHYGIYYNKVHKCKVCDAEYTRQEVVRRYGSDFTFGYCSPPCRTKRRTEIGLEEEPPKLKISKKDCSYCGEEKGFICYTEGICIECAEQIVNQLRTGVRVSWSRYGSERGRK